MNQLINKNKSINVDLALAASYNMLIDNLLINSVQSMSFMIDKASMMSPLIDGRLSIIPLVA